MGGTIYDWLTIIFGNGLTGELQTWMTNVLNAAQDILSGDLVTIIMNTFGAIACCLLIIYFFQDLMNQASKDMFSFEKLVVMFIRMFIAFCILLYSKEIIELAIQWADAFVKICKGIGDSMTGTVSSFSPAAKSAYEDEYSGLIGGFHAIGVIGALLVPYVISFFAELMGKFIMVSTTIMFIVRLVFTPMAIVQVFEEGSRSAGIRYIKNLLAEGMSLGIILLIISVANAFSAALVNSILPSGLSLEPGDSLKASLTFSTFIPIVIPKLVIVGGMASASKIAHEVMGA